MVENIKRMDAKEFQEKGYLQELNRQFLHPLGLALEVIVNTETGDVSFGKVWDYRDDTEGIIFAKPLSEDFIRKAKFVADEQKRFGGLRQKSLGFVIQLVSD